MFLFLGHTAFAQEKFFHHFTVDDGLPSNVIYKTAQDENGFIWICTEKGLVRFDGYEFKLIDHLEKKLGSNDVWEFVIDKHRRKWVFTMDVPPVIISEGKANTLNDLTPERSNNLEPWSYSTYTLKYATNSNLLLLNRTDSTIYYLNKRNRAIKIPISKNIITNLLDRKILHLALDRNEFFLIYESGKIETWSLEKNISTSSHEHLLSDDIEIFHEENIRSKENTMFIRDGNKLYKFLNGRLDLLKYQFLNPTPNSIIGSSEKYLFIKEKGDLYTIDKKNTTIKKLVTKNIKGARHAFEDQEKNLWIASQEDGVYFLPYHARQTKIYNETNGLSLPKITAMAFDNKGRLYLGNNFGSDISVFDGNSFNKIPKNNRKDYFIHVDSLDNIWLTGINLINKGKTPLISNTSKPIRYNYSKKDGFTVNHYEAYPKSFCVHNQSLFFGRRNLYKATLENNVFHLDSIWHSRFNIYALESDEKHNIYIGTTNGVYIYNESSGTANKIIHKKLNGNIRDIAFKNNTLWIASDQHGLVIYDLKKQTTQIALPLSQSTVSHIHYDSTESVMWVSTNKGLCKMPLNYHSGIEITHFTTSNGLPVNEVNSCLTRDNKIYAGTTRGLAILENKEPDTTYKPRILATRFNVNKEELPIVSGYDLKHNQNHIIIELTALSFSSLGNIKYRYKLQGADDDWSIGKTRILEYPNLPPGNYKLLAEAYDANGQRTLNKISIRINIKPSIPQTWWFRALAILMTILLISWFFYWRSEENNKKNILEKQFSNLKLEALQSQLNSHFIFNALNAIQAYIIQKDERQASRYMSQFANLMRAFLDSSRNRTISITDEIEFIKTYISLEQLIYEGKFESHLSIDPKLNINQQIPSNIIQPFIENAILHGLMPLKRKGKLEIHFSASDRYVAQCRITDDGVGYNKSQQNKTIKSKSHGQNIIHERIAILKEDHELEVDVEIIDRMKESNEDGTIIIINFKNNGAD